MIEQPKHAKEFQKSIKKQLTDLINDEGTVIESVNYASDPDNDSIIENLNIRWAYIPELKQETDFEGAMGIINP